MNIDRSRRRLQAAAWATTAILATIIGVLTLTPSVGAAVAGNDKISHFLAFMVLVLPISVVNPQRSLAIVLIAGGYGLAIEIIQPYFNRAAEFADLLADLLGAGTGALLGRSLGMRFRQLVSA